MSNRIVPAAYLASHTLSLFGNTIAGIALPLVILQTTGSALGAGIVASATAIPAVLGGLFLGVVIDRINRRTSSITADLVSGISVGLLPLIDMVSGLNLAWFIIMGVIGSLGDVPGRTAREALLPAIVRHGEISPERLVGMREGLGAFAMLIGPAVAGTLMVVLDGSTVLWVTASTSIAAALVSLLIPRHAGVVVGGKNQQGPHRGMTWHQLRAGWREMFTNRFLIAVTLLGIASMVVITGLQGMILPVYFTLVDTPGLLGFVVSAMSAGMMLGGGVYASLGRRGSRRRWFVTGVLGVLLGFAGIASLAATWLIFVGAFVVGISSSLFTSLLGVLLIERVPENMRGRVMGTRNALMTAVPAIGIMLAAGLTELVGVRTAALCVAVIWFLATIAALAEPALRSLEPKQSDDDDAGEPNTEKSVP